MAFIPPALPVIDVWKLIRRIAKSFLWQGLLTTFLIISVGVFVSEMLYLVLQLLEEWVFSSEGWDISSQLEQLASMFTSAPFAGTISYAVALDWLLLAFDVLFTITFWLLVSMPAVVATCLSVFITLMVKKVIAHDVERLME